MSSKYPLSQVPIPPLKRPPLSGRAPVYPWAEMRVGDSFFVAVPLGRNFTAPSGRVKSHPGEKYEIRRVVEDGTTGFRVWRTK